MATIKEILDRLPQQDRELLEYAFQHEIPQFVRLEGNRFIGVNIDYITYLEPDSKVGVWATGRDKSVKVHNGRI